MNTFGLGLVLSFTDHATAGIQNATGAFNDLNQSVIAFSNSNDAEAALLQLSTVAGIVGNELYSLGNSITSFYTGIISNVNNVGSTLMSARSQLSTLYGSDEAGQRVLDQIKEYSAKSIFNFEDLIPSVIMLKANGIEAFDEIATSAYRASNGVEGYSQTLMDYAADLAAFNPTMHNMYGTGVQAAMGALNEYIAEGNAASLKRGASLDILQLLGEEKGKTIEERSRQVADLIEQLGMVGMTANLAGTPMQRLSNIEDVFFNLMSDISDSGVFEKYSQLIEKFTDYLFNIPDEELEEMAHVIAEALVDIMTPLEYLVDLGIKVIDWLRNLFKESPEMAKMIIKGTALAGVFMLITGESLKLISALGRLKFSISMLFGNGSFSGGLSLLGLLKNITKYILPIVAAVTLLKVAWDKDFMGMQDSTKKFLREMVDTFKILFDAWGDYSLSEDNFERAKELGILPFVESILQLKYHLGYLAEGFKKGFNAFFDQLGAILVRLGILDERTHGFRDLVIKLIDKLTAPGMTNAWERFGEILGNSVGWILLALALLPLVIKFISLITLGLKLVLFTAKAVVTVLSIIPKLFTALKLTVLFLKDMVFYVQYGLFILKTSVIPAMTKFFALFAGSVGIVALIVVAVVALIALVWVFRDKIAKFLVDLGSAIGKFFKNLFKTIANSAIAKFIVSVVMTLWTVIKSIILAIYNIIKDVVTLILKTVVRIINIIISFVKMLISIIRSILGIVKTIVVGVWNLVKPLIMGILDLFSLLWDTISSVLSWIGNLFKEVFTWVYNEIISPVISAIGTAFEWVAENVFAPFGNFVSGIFTGIADVVHWLCGVVDYIFKNIESIMIGAFEAASKVITGILDGISKVIGTIIKALVKAINLAGDLFESVADKASDFLIEISGKSDGSNIFDRGEGFSNAVKVIDARTDLTEDEKKLAYYKAYLQWFKDYTNEELKGITSVPGAATGGYTLSEGLVNLHPNELVVNNELTKMLGTFLSDYSSRPSALVTQDIVATDDFREREDISGTPLVVPAPSNTPPSKYQETTNNDNSVVFEQGSIVFNIDKDTDLANMSEEELSALAEKLMKIITRKLQLKSMQTRK